MEKCFQHWIKQNKKGNSNVLSHYFYFFYFWYCFPELLDTNSQFWLFFSQVQIYFTQLWPYTFFLYISTVLTEWFHSWFHSSPHAALAHSVQSFGMGIGSNVFPVFSIHANMLLIVETHAEKSLCCTHLGLLAFWFGPLSTWLKIVAHFRDVWLINKTVMESNKRIRGH